jgi:hypothetical protein
MGFLKKILPTAIGAVTGGPAGAFAGFVTASEAERQQKRAIRQQEQQRKQQEQEAKKFMEIFGSNQNIKSLQPNYMGTTSQSGFGSGFGQFLTDVGQNIVSPFANIASTVLPFFGNRVTQPAITTPTINGPKETTTSGTSDAFISPSLVNPLVNFGRSLLKSPVGNIAVGTGAGALVGGLTAPSQGGMRITRKMKSQARMVLNMTGGNIQAASDILGVDQNTLIFILLKRFRNDGPVVTKAALRKTKQTVRRLKSMCDMYDDLRPRARAVRRTPVRRSSTTLIKN